MEEVKETVVPVAQEAVVEAAEQKTVEEQVTEQLSLDELKKTAGREFKNREDFLKHYTNLKNFVGTKAEHVSAEMETTKRELQEVESWFKDAGIDRKTANPFEIAKIAKAMAPRPEGETKATTPAPMAGKMERVQALGKKVLQGSDDAKVALVAEFLGMKQNINPSERRVAEHISGLRNQ